MRHDAVTLRQLRALIAVERFGSMTGAAAELGLTVPAIHSQIRGLEAALAAPVVRRKADNAGSSLTAEGKAVLHAATRIEGILSQCATEVRAISRGLTGRVMLGVVSTGKYFAPWLVKMLREIAPGIEIVLRIGNRDSITSGLDLGTLDLAIMGRPPRYPIVEAEPLGPHPHGLLVAPDHPLAGTETTDVDHLLDQVFLSREEGSGTRILMTRYLDRIGEGSVIEFLEMESNETIKQAAMAGLGVAFLSLHTVTEEVATGRLVRLNAPGLPITRQWYLVQPSGKDTRSVVEQCKRHILGLRGSYFPKLDAR